MEPVNFAGTITDTELAKEGKHHAEALVVQQTGLFEFHVLVRMPPQGHWRALSTRRNPGKPRSFKSLDRLTEKLKRDFPGIGSVTFQLLIPTTYELDLRG